MASPRTDRKTDYRHFPQAYSELLQQFADKGTARLGPMSWSAALGGRRDLYRYRMFLINAVEDDPADTFARELYDAARDVTMRIEGAGNRCFIVLELNPIVAAMRTPQSAEATSEVGSDTIDGRSPYGSCPATSQLCTDPRCSLEWCQRQEHYP